VQVGSVETGARGVLKPAEGKSNPAGGHDFLSVLATVTGDCWQPLRDQSNHFLLAPLLATGLVSSSVVQKTQLVELKQADVAMVSGDLWFGGVVEAELAGSLQNTLASPLCCNGGKSAAVACGLPDTWFAAQAADQVGQGEERNPLPGLTPLIGRQLSNAGKPSLEKLCLGNISGFRLPATGIRKIPALSSGYEIKSENNPVPAVEVQSNTGEVSVPGTVRQIPVEDSVLLHREFTTGSKSNVETEMQWVVRGEVVKNGGHDGSVAFSDLSRVRFPVIAAMQEVNISLASAAGRLREQFSSEAELQLAGSKTESAAAVVVAATQKSELQNSPWLFVQYGQDFGAGAERFESMLVPSEMVVKTEGIYKDNGWKHDITPQASILPAPGADIPIPSSSAPLGAVLVSAFCQVVSRGGFNRTIIRLKLEPEHLGELKVLLTYFRGKLTADFYTFNHPAREAVEALFPQLREVLASYNVRLENAAVHLNQNDGYGEGGSLKNEGSDKDPAKSGQLYGLEDPVPAGTEDGRKMYVAESVIDRLV